MRDTTGSAKQRRVVVAALGITQILAWGSSYYLPAVLATAIAADTGWPLSGIFAGVSLGFLVAGLTAPSVGRIIERRGGKPVLAASAVLFAVGLAGLGLAPTLPVHILAWLVVGLGMGCGLYDAAFSTLGRLYGAAARGPITALTLWGGFASTVCWPLSAFLVGALSWRGACLVYAALHLALALPLYLAALPDAPPHAPREAIATDSRPAAGPGVPARAGRLVLLTVILTVGGGIASLWSVHVLALLQGRGATLETAVALGALIGPAQVGARVLEMLAGERHHPIATLLASVLLIAAGLVALAFGAVGLALPLVLFGAGNGIWSIARGTLPLTLFGPVGYAALMGRLAMPGLLAMAAAPAVGAVLLANAGAAATLTALAAAAAVNVVLVAALALSIRRG